MLDAVVHAHVARGVGSMCFACGGVLTVRTGDFHRCASCRAENYCPQTNVPVEERARRWFRRRGVMSAPCVARAISIEARARR